MCTTDPSELTTLVSGWLEVIVPREGAPVGGWVAYLNEEGKLHGLPANERATLLARAAGWYAPTDFLVGTVVFMGRHGPAEADVPEPLLELARRLGVWTDEDAPPTG